MDLYNIAFEVKNAPVLDKTFVPAAKFCQAFLKGAEKPLAVALERNGGCTYVFETKVRAGAEFEEANRYYVDRMVKALLWCVGGFKVTVCGDEKLAAHIKSLYCEGGEREFDADLMSNVYGKPFEVNYASYEDRPAVKENAQSLGRHLDGCRIGFDAGGSDRKVSAVINGESVYSEEVVWQPKITADPSYHFNEIVSAFKTAASKMPKVDAIGISSAGIYVDNETKIASLFLKVPKGDFEKYVKDIYIRAGKEIGDIPLVVCNDGDVTALAGAMSLDDTNILGIAMGTSEAGGYVDGNGNITGWLNELAFAPCDFQPEGSHDEWSGDIGCGVKYFSQDAVIKLAPRVGIELDAALSPGDKLKVVQNALKDGNLEVEKIFETIGAYLGHTLAFYALVYDMKHVLLMGRVTSGRGGDIILEKAREVMRNEYPDVCGKINLQLPDEKSRRVGQSVAAASLPEIG
ncbi:MAG: ROK family protein [Clostridiales bacterium]|jgi:predicted NBD/HSP70 family sugar kinase|nr:ROK family protein [Clostridiales bacterium]